MGGLRRHKDVIMYVKAQTQNIALAVSAIHLKLTVNFCPFFLGN
jgi:hypothetical protein